ncbi:MAG TPA: CinA family nicotinamide mononucleotide deamidase-related protein, partial [Bacteroidia bacterium]|nr:CinA family nicotinamide mononucleotide deamidase-related protein [Bacteroidia bacterium]
MLADIITIGDELLIGQVVDTNSAWIGQQLSGIGIRVRQKTTVSDDAQHITAALDQSKKRADLILITGGLGPTNDDITKKTLCEYFGMGWKMDDEVLEDVHKMFARFGKEVSAVNRLQAQIPDGCAVLRNRFGSAPGMWFEQDGKIFVSMPGVPHEMKVIMEECVIPTLRKRFSLPVIVHKNILVHGLGESILAEKIAAWEESLAKESLKLAYLPVPGLVRLRISGEGLDAKLLNEIVRVKVNELVKLIPKYVVGFDDDSLESVIGKLLTEKKKTVSTAESCTGGLIAHAITRIPGSSNYYMGSII